MRLLKSHTDNRLCVKLDKSISSYGKKGIKGYMKFGDKNDYPQTVENIVNGSITAKSVKKVYSKFLCGEGFEEDVINGIVIGKDVKGKKITMMSLLRQVCDSMALNHGAYIHLNVNLNREVTEATHVQFKKCRFAKIDDLGYTSYIGVYENWEKSKDAKFEKDKIRWYHIFNLDQNVFESQIKEVGSIEKYKGQMYFLFLDNEYLYPLSPFDPVYLDCDTEQQVALFKNNSTRNGMIKKTIVRLQEPVDGNDEEDLIEELEEFEGVDGSNVMVIYDEIDENGEIKKSGAFDIDTVESSIDDQMFAGWQTDLSNNIRKAVNALPAILIDYDESKLGTTSGEGIIQATNFFNAMTKDDRKAISEMFKEIFSKFDNKILKENTNWEIKPLSLYDGNTQLQSTTDDQTNLTE